VSFVGGGTDLPKYYESAEHPGRVFSAAINKYIYITLNRKFDGKIRVGYSVTENVESVDDIRHDIVRNTMKAFNMGSGWEIVSVADIPGHGSGLGSSSAFTVGLINAIQHEIFGKEKLNRQEIADMACNIEINACGKPVGRQDQWACALGGMNEICFGKQGKVWTQPILEQRYIKELNNHLLLFYLGPRKNNNILKDQNNRMNEAKMKTMECMAELANEAMLEVATGNYQALGQLMDINWEYKRTLAPGISNSVIQGIYTRAMRAGAEGGKVLGQGGGGFMLFYAEPHFHQTVKDAVGLKNVPFNFVDKGTQVIYAA
jgi:D-glycero-alpha-D-manno-heptose-7-phosphate kinase